MAYNSDVRIDLHIHSTASDGTLTPREILSLAQHLKLGAISITDHDTIQGAKEAIDSGIPDSIKFMTGVEISTTPPSLFHFSGSFHILGYRISLDDSALNKSLKILQEARENRAPRIIERLSNLGIDLSMKDVTAVAGDGLIGRPHIAQVLVKKQAVSSINEAFDRYLGRGKPAYVDKYRIDCDQAIQMIINAGGIPVLAHPFLLNIRQDDVLENLICILKEMGLMGIEVYYPEHSSDLQRYYAEMATRYGLLITGGTDFHGSLKPDIKMGTGRGDLFVPYEVYEKLARFQRH